MAINYKGMPITNALYGDDHPSLRPPYPAWEAQHPGTRIASLIPEATLRRIVRYWPRCKKYLPRKDHS